MAFIRRTRRVVLFLAAATVATACGSGSEAPTEQASGATIDFTAETVGAGSIDMADYAGEPLALWFWSPW